ncbi:ABC transporter permease [Planotetraspora kaengkrachanensis]|uniref:Ribose import permease protein RbsC n=1 Tax=Planotetraspora kaengkrachanensis TaxID=575193 RepID=A0A8J3PYH9_9ACTN|nr:ABC transporter permease [Planotetraspora kaengkrachanensis]GIG83424.1 ribose import permease protein RbsC [Planotetraspora kaengkrachanensis]
MTEQQTSAVLDTDSGEVARATAPASDRWRAAVPSPTVLVLIGAAIAIVVVAGVTNDSFLTEGNMTNLLRQMVSTGLLALGMLLVILTGGIDLSVGSVVALTGIMSAGLVSGLPLPLAILAAVVVGVLCGTVNGAMVARFSLAPFVVTLASMTTFRGLTYVYSKTPITPTTPDFLTLGSQNVGAIPIAAIVTLAMFALGWVLINRTSAGRALLGIGGNREAVRLAGVKVRRHLVLAYALSGLCAGVAGVILASRVGIAQPSVGQGFELDAIAACVIGGASLSGGRGTIGGTLAGVVLLGLIDNLLSLYDVQSYWQQVLKGLIIAVAILVRRGERQNT